LPLAAPVDMVFVDCRVYHHAR